MLLNLVTPLHEATFRDYRGRLLDDKVNCMLRARNFELEYWDGERRTGYGGYQYMPGRWEPVARELIRMYALKPGDKILDIGCGKGFLLYEMQKLMPGLEFVGIDRSLYALSHMHPNLKATTRYQYVQDGLSYRDKEFALVISLGTLHNLTLSELWRTLPEIQRVGLAAYIMVESFRDEQEWYNLCAWCLTAESLMRPEDWKFLYEKCGYRGDFEFIYFQ